MQQITFNQKELTPSKIICIGLNYVEHIKELGNTPADQPVVFLKPNSAISKTLIAGTKDLIHYEAEISFIIEHNEIAGVGFGLDLTKRDLQTKLRAKGMPWERAKAFDAAAVFSDFVSFDKNKLSQLNIKLFINDTLVQQAGVELMIYKPDFILQDIKENFSLEDGDIIMTGTPVGVDSYKAGDRFVGEIYLGDERLIKQEWISC